jgi:hypothetical protein
MAKRVRKELGYFWFLCDGMQCGATPLASSSHTLRYNVHTGDIKPADVTTMLCRASVASLFTRRLEFISGLVQVGFLLDEVALRRILLRVFRSFPVSTSAPVLCAYSSVANTVSFQQLTASLHNTLKNK